MNEQTENPLTEIARAIERIDSSEEGRSSIELAGELIADGLYRLGNTPPLIGNLGDSKPAGALEAHGQAVAKAGGDVAAAIRDLAQAIREVRHQ